MQRGQLGQDALGQAAVGRDLAAEHPEQWRAALRVQGQDIVAGGFLRTCRAIVVEQADAGVGPGDVGRRQRTLEVAGCRLAGIVDVLWRRVTWSCLFNLVRSQRGFSSTLSPEEGVP